MIQQLALGPHEPAGRVASLTGVWLELDDLRSREERRGLPLDHLHASPVARRLGEDLQHVSPRERRPLSRQSLLALEPHGERVEVELARRVETSPQDLAKLQPAEAMLRGARTPLLPQPIHRHPVLLAPPSLQRRDLRRARRPLSAGRHQLEDLRPAQREVLDHPTRHTEHICRPALH